MQKKLLAVAVAGALTAPALALAQTSTVQIYGVANVEYQFLKQGAGLRSLDGFGTPDSRLGVRGSEKLGGGLTAWFQCENSMAVTGEDAVDGFCGRNSGVGFRGAFGNVFIGNWDTPFKLSQGGSNFRPFGTTGAFGVVGLLSNGSASNVGNGVLAAAGGIGTGSTTNSAAGFSRRQANSVNWHSPSWNGLQVMAGYSTTDEATGIAPAAPAGKPRMYSLGAVYTNGPLGIGAGYENHKDYNPGSQAAYTGGNDHSWGINAAYTFNKVFRLGGVYTVVEYEPLPAQNAKRNSWGIYGDWAIQGPHSLRLGYTKAGDVKGNSTVSINDLAASGSDTGAALWAIQYAYRFSKRTQVTVGYARVDNDRLGRYRLQSLAARNVGQDQSAFVLGVRHSF